MEHSNLSPSIKDLVAHLEAHEAFLMTPEGKAWKKIQEQTVDYLSLLPTAPLNFKPDSIVNNILKGRGFKRGELSIIAAKSAWPYENVPSNFMANEILPHIRNNDAVFHINLETPPKDVEQRYLTLVHGKTRTDSEGAFKVTPINDARIDDSL